MAKLDKTSGECLKLLLKDFSLEHTITSLSKEIGNTRMGIWKTLKKLQANKFISLEPVGKGKTSTYIARLNLENPLVEKTLATILTEDAIGQERWRDNFKKLEQYTLFIVLFGSILHFQKEARDIDILVVVKTRKDFKIVETILSEAQQTQIKKIHAIDLTKEELRTELKKEDRAYVEALKKGVILFGQENFIKFIEDISK